MGGSIKVGARSAINNRPVAAHLVEKRVALPHSAPPPTSPIVPKRQHTDALTDVGLLALVVIWGVNFSVVKVALEELEPHAFNALRFPLACLVLYIVLRLRRLPLVPERKDWLAIVGVAVLGNVVYQWVFIIGIDETRAGNAAVILATVPVWTAFLSLGLGHERPGPALWAGTVGTLVGMSLVVLGGPSAVDLGGATLRGDVLMIIAAVCWATYTVGSRPLVTRYGALPVTAWTVWVGTVGLLIVGAPSLARMNYAGVSTAAWLAVVYAGIFALAVAYVAWYRGVEKIGSSRTATYSNLIPVVALAVAWVWIGEVPSVLQLLGAAVIIGSLTLARRGPVSAPRSSTPVASGVGVRETRRGSDPRS